MSEEEPSIPQYIIVSFMLLITFYLTFLYIKTKEFHTYACYNVIIMSIMIFVGSVIIMIPNTLGNDYTQFFIGILESFSYKIVMTILTNQIIVLYLGIVKTEFYYQKEKKIFIWGIIISSAVSFIISLIFSILKFFDSKYHEYLNNYKEIQKDLSEHNNDNVERRFHALIIIEMVFNGIILLINIFCLAVVLKYLTKKKQEAQIGLIEDLGYKEYLIRFILMFIINIIAIAASSFFLVFDIFESPTTNQSIYLGICLIIDLIYSFNKTVYQETLKIFCKKCLNNKEKEKLKFELKEKRTFGEPEDNVDEDDN